MKSDITITQLLSLVGSEMCIRDRFGPDFSKAYWIVGDDWRKYTISEGMYNKLNAEYNNSVAGHKLNIFFNVKKTARSGHITYMADNITTDSGIIIK